MSEFQAASRKRTAAPDRCNAEPEAKVARGTVQGTARVLRHLQACEGTWSETTMRLAASLGHLASVRFLHERGCPWDAQALRAAVQNGHFDVVRYLGDHGCPRDADIIDVGVQQNRLDMVRYLHETGSTFDSKNVTSAAQAGNLDILRYLHEHGCPWEERAVDGAIRCKQIDAVRFLREHGCPWDAIAWKAAADANDETMAEYLADQGCPKGTADAAARHNLERMLAMCAQNPAVCDIQAFLAISGVTPVHATHADGLYKVAFSNGKIASFCIHSEFSGRLVSVSKGSGARV